MKNPLFYMQLMLSLINYSPVVMVMNLLTMYNFVVVVNYMIIIKNVSELIG
jgi:hypothetical protein